MKVSGNGFDFNATQSLLPVGPSGPSGLKPADFRSADQADAQDFSSLLSKGASDSNVVAKPVKSGSRDTASTRAERASKGGPAQGASNGVGSKQGSASLLSGSPVSGSSSQVGDVSPQSPSIPEKNAEGTGSVGSDSGLQDQGTADTLLSTASDLPVDPRLVDPSELAMEAAAIAALLASSSGAIADPPKAPSQAESGASDFSLDVSVSGGGTDSSSPYLSQMALRNLQASLSPAPRELPVLLASSELANSVSSPQAANGAEDGGTVANQGSVSEKAVQPQVSLPNDPLAGLFAKSAVDAAAKVQPLALPISSQLISLAASPSEVAALVAASAEKAKAALGKSSQNESSALGDSNGLVGDVRSAVLSASEFLTGQTEGAAKAVESQVAGVPAPEVKRGDLKSVDASGVSSEASQAPAAGVAAVASTEGDAQSPSDSDRGNAPSDSKQGGQGNLSKPVVYQRAKLPQSDVQSGTLGASEKAVSTEETNVKARLAAESLPVSGDEAPQASLVTERTDASSSATGTTFGSGARPLSEVVSKPTVLPPVQSRAGEVWKVIQDAVQRARSENPSHLAVEVRMDDGSTLGVELRMSSAGLQASFRSESQSLLRSIEAQWSAFVSKEPADARVTSAVFESRSGFGGSTDSGTSGGERRQQMEDASTAASLGRSNQQGSAGASSASGKASAPVHVQNGRISAYA